MAAELLTPADTHVTVCSWQFGTLQGRSGFTVWGPFIIEMQVEVTTHLLDVHFRSDCAIGYRVQLKVAKGRIGQVQCELSFTLIMLVPVT